MDLHVVQLAFSGLSRSKCLLGCGCPRNAGIFLLDACILLTIPDALHKKLTVKSLARVKKCAFHKMYAFVDLISKFYNEAEKKAPS